MEVLIFQKYYKNIYKHINLKKLLLVLLISVSCNLQAMLISNNYINNDLKVLQELDLKSTYITDYEFQIFYNKFSKKHTQTYAKKLQKAQLFIPLIKDTLVQNNIPSAFLYLAMAESNFVLKAKSYKKAMGVWQFMPKTAHKFGLKIDYYSDERLDIVKSTKAASRYLNILHDMFGKWYVAAIAYNCGEGRVIEGITRATLDMYCQNNKCKKDPKILKYRRTIKAYQDKRVQFNEIYKIYKTVIKWQYKPDIEELLIVQKNLKRQYIPEESRNYIRKIISLAMMNNTNELIKDENTHLLNTGISSSIAKVEVKGGFLLKNIAEIINMSKKDLKEINPHIKKNIIPPEEKNYAIYIPYSKLSLFNNNIENIKTNVFEMHIVKRGDSLGKIAQIYNTKYKVIKKYNNLKTNVLRIGQNLIIPIDPDTYKRAKIYFVKKGDTLHKIARIFNIPLKIILRDNKYNILHIGDKILVSYK